MKLGIIGVGHLAKSILEGLVRSQLAPGEVVLSPRGHGREMARRHGFDLAQDNREVVSRSDVVLLAVRPPAAEAAVTGLPWRPGQILLSACAGISISRLSAAAGEVEVIRIMPITAAELGASPTLVYPHRKQLDPLLSRLGSIIELDSEDQFEAATVSAAIYGWVQALITISADWSTARGLDEASARQLVARTFVAAGRMVAEKDAPMAAMLAELATPGGITEAGLGHLRDAGVPEAWESACETVLRRLQNRS